MTEIRTRRDLASLLEKQMTAASARQSPGADEDIEGRTALKTYLLQAHGRMRSETLSALVEVAASAGLDLAPTDEPDLLALTQGEHSFWLDVSDKRFFRLHTTAVAKEADRVHQAVVTASPLIEPAWVLPRALESLAENVAGKMVLFSLRHDRRPLRREPDEAHGAVELVTLRFWAPSAAETLARLRGSNVLPGATSVYSVRVRAGEPDAYALAEVYHNGKFTSIGSSFAALENLIARVARGCDESAAALERARRAGASTQFPARWSAEDLSFAVGRMFNGSEPFGLWGLPEKGGDERFRVRAVDLGVAAAATFELWPGGARVELAEGTSASVAARFFSALQYHVHADVECDALSDAPLLASGRKARAPGTSPAFDERSDNARVARVVLSECVSHWIRGAHHVSAPSLLAGLESGAHATPAMADLARRVLHEAAAYEWREWLRPVQAADGSTQWKWRDPPPLDANARTRELGRMHRAAAALVTRVSGGVAAPWTQLSLFGAAALVPPVPDEEP